MCLRFLQKIGMAPKPPRRGSLMERRASMLQRRRSTITSRKGSIAPSTVEELVTEEKEEKNWKGIGLALLVIVIVLGLVITASILVIPASEDVVMGAPFSFKSKFDVSLMPRSLHAQWAGPNTYVHSNEEGSLVAVDLLYNKTTFIMTNNTFRQLNTRHFWVSPDLKYVLLAYNTARINRFTQEGYYTIYNVRTKKLRNLPAGSEELIQHASWGPTGNSVAFVKKNALYYQSSVAAAPIALTNTDDPDYIYNAMPDWLYEEEITKSDHAYWWSPSGKHLAFLRLDDKGVANFTFPTYTNRLNVGGSFRTVRYPKAGDQANPLVELFVVNVQGLTPRGPPKKTKLDPPDSIKNSQHYMLEISWKNADTVAVTWMNRVQNYSAIVLCSAMSGTCSPSLTETTKNGAIPWLEMDQKALFTPDGNSYFLVLPQQDGTAGYYQHVTMVTSSSNQEGHRMFLTHGQFDVTEVVGYDDKEKYVYVLAAFDSPRKRRLLKIGTPTSKAPKKVTCLTCDFNNTCEYVSAKFSPNGRYYFLSCLGPEIPRHYLKDTQDPTFNVTLESNEDVKKNLEKLALPKKEYHTVPIAGGAFNATLQMYLPPQLNKKHVIKYPVLLYVYGGPNSQLVTERYVTSFDSYMTSGQAMIVASLDGRGTRARGSKYKATLYRNFGTVEVDDQLSAIKFLQEMAYVDEDNIAVYGWSYGGFMTGHIVGRGSGLVHCAVVGAPVTDFRYYDTFWTERYMGSPDVSDNLNGYEATSIMRRVKGFKKSKVLVVHGTGDDNVHFQNSAHLIRELIQANVQFETQIYPDERHQLDAGSLEHFYIKLTNFLNNCYQNDTRNYITNPAVREPEKKKSG